MLLKLKNIGKIYDSNGIFTIGIRGINLELDYNEFVTIEGESGSGKSTLLNVIGANDTYEEGELYFNGEETSHYSESDWERYRENNIATIFQDFNIIENLTVLENVELALLRIEDKKERRRRAKELIERVGLGKQINQRGSKLSGGEKQRTVIARALAKDSPVILADEPTGNLDVKASKEVASLLKELSKDKLVIVVTHNPEFFKEYATRRIRVFDGKISEDKLITKPKEREETEEKKEDRKVSKWLNLKNTFHIGALNYKSRPKFTLMMSFALFVCAITMFFVVAIFGQGLIKPTTTTLDHTGITGKVIISNQQNKITQKQLDEVAGKTKAGFFFLDRELSQFSVSIPKLGGMLREHEIVCLYSPYEHNIEAGKAVLVVPNSQKGDADTIKEVFLNAGIGLYEISIESSLNVDGVYLYLSYDDLNEYGEKIQALYSMMTFGTDKTRVYSFEVNENLLEGQVNLVNSNFYSADGKTVVFDAKTDKSYIVIRSDEKNNEVSGLIVQMNRGDYEAMFLSDDNAVQSVLFYKNNDEAKAAIALLPEGYIGMLSTTTVYVQDVMDVFTINILWYLALIAVGLIFAMLISVIFMRSVKIYQADFSVYRTLGISRKISANSLYMQMLFIFLPTLILLPIVSLIMAILPGSNFMLISIGNYIFIEIMMLLIVEFVAYGFNKSINSQSIRKSLRRGSK